MSRRKKRAQAHHTNSKQCRTLKPKTENQAQYIEAVQQNQITICVGPAGTGKTCIATSLAILGLLEGSYNKIILTRPLVQAGEDTGYLPGNINKKLDPYIRPIYDEMGLYIDKEEINLLLENDAIEVTPFAYMRGRNFHNAFIVADELQNASAKQLKMLVTRIGRYSKMVLTGDFTQSDLPNREQGALESYLETLKNVEGVAVVELTFDDIVREPIVERLLRAMENYDAQTSQKDTHT